MDLSCWVIVVSSAVFFRQVVPLKKSDKMTKCKNGGFCWIADFNTKWNSCVVVATRYGNYNLRNMCKMFLTKHRWCPKNLLICYIKYLLLSFRLNIYKKTIFDIMFMGRNPRIGTVTKNVQKNKKGPKRIFYNCFWIL